MPEVGLALRRRLIRVRPIGGELPPPDRRRPDDAFANRFFDPRNGGEGTAIILDHDARATGNRPALGVERMENAFRLPSGTPQRVDIYERGVEKLVSGRGNQRQWIA